MEEYEEEAHKSQLRANIAEAQSLCRKYYWVRYFSELGFSLGAGVIVACVWDITRGKSLVLNVPPILLMTTCCVLNARNWRWSHARIRSYTYIARQLQSLSDNWHNETRAILAIDQVMAELKEMK